MEREDWNRRYAGRELLWSAAPNRFLEAETRELPPGRALDLACGEGRNALWLAGRGWRVTGVDFSEVALERARRRAAERGLEAEWLQADVRDWVPERRAFDLVALCYLQLPRRALEPVLARAAEAVAPGGTLLVVGHDRRNLEEGCGGPQDPAVLLDPDEVAAALGALRVERAERVLRPVEAEGATAVDTLVRASRPAGPA